jgi:lipopolysaccharide/colanic/teichoic acid biosynthesis glycosyltransferase
MTGDVHGAQGEPLASGLARIPAPRRESDFVAPLTVGRPRWQRRYAHSAMAIDAAALASLPILHLLWRHAVAQPLLAAVLSACTLTLVGRTALRSWLRHLRRQGRAMSSVLALGTVEDVSTLVGRTRASAELGWRVLGACTSTGCGDDGATAIAGVPVVGDLDTVASLALTGHFDAVAVGPAPGWTAVRLQQLAWDLDCSRTALLVDPRLVRLAGPRMRVTGIPGLPLLRLDHPTLTRVPRLMKGAIDRFGALLLLAVVAPVLLSCAIAVRRDGGPALRRRPRLGRGGREFTLLTFRTTATGTGSVTPVGRVLRRLCLDELPQLLNVLGGSMALVGPRPPVPSEVPSHRADRRRLLVKPGLTGLWPVGGLHHPGDAEDPGLALRYVQHWSPALDVRILVSSVRVALHGKDR